MTTRIPQTDLKVCIGIDVHRKTYATHALCEDGAVKRCSMEAQPEKLARYILKHLPIIA